MAYRRIQRYLNGDCQEKIQFFGNGEWGSHPTRGVWAPCGTYPALNIEKEVSGGKYENLAVLIKNDRGFIANEENVFAPSFVKKEPLMLVRNNEFEAQVSKKTLFDEEGNDTPENDTPENVLTPENNTSKIILIAVALIIAFYVFKD